MLHSSLLPGQVMGRSGYCRRQRAKVIIHICMNPRRATFCKGGTEHCCCLGSVAMFLVTDSHALNYEAGTRCVIHLSMRRQLNKCVLSHLVYFTLYLCWPDHRASLAILCPASHKDRRRRKTGDWGRALSLLSPVAICLCWFPEESDGLVSWQKMQSHINKQWWSWGLGERKQQMEFFFFTEGWLIHNVLVSRIQQSESCIFYIYIHI